MYRRHNKSRKFNGTLKRTDLIKPVERLNNMCEELQTFKRLLDEYVRAQGIQDDIDLRTFGAQIDEWTNICEDSLGLLERVKNRARIIDE